jgi:hypothetical protein
MQTQGNPEQFPKKFIVLFGKAPGCAGIAVDIVCMLFGVCSDFSRVHPNIPSENPNKVRTKSAANPVQSRQESKEWMLIPNKISAFAKAL